MEPNREARTDWSYKPAMLAVLAVLIGATLASRGNVRRLFLTLAIALVLGGVVLTLAHRRAVDDRRYDSLWTPAFLRATVPSPGTYPHGEMQNLGRQHFAASRVIVCGLARNCAPNVAHIREQVR